MTDIKICGLTRQQDIEAVNRYQPDYIGFVFAPSRRKIDLAKAKELKASLLPCIKAVGVYVNTPPEEILEAANSHVIDVIQLHGDEDETYIQALRAFTSLPIIKAVRVSSTEDIWSAEQLSCDYLLLDSFVKGINGGSGQTFPWTMIPKIKKPYFLAGGISIDNLKEAAMTGACCLDLSSAVESNGIKDPEKIRKIIEKIRSMNLCQTEDLDSTEANLYQRP